MMRDVFGRRRSRRSPDGFRACSMGVWLSLGAIAMVMGMGTQMLAGTPAPDATIEAGPIDDTIDYIECLIRRLQNLPCEGDPDYPAPPPAEPEPGDPIP